MMLGSGEIDLYMLLRMISVWSRNKTSHIPQDYTALSAVCTCWYRFRSRKTIGGGRMPWCAFGWYRKDRWLNCGGKSNLKLLLKLAMTRVGGPIFTADGIGRWGTVHGPKFRDDVCKDTRNPEASNKFFTYNNFDVGPVNEMPCHPASDKRHISNISHETKSAH